MRPERSGVELSTVAGRAIFPVFAKKYSSPRNWSPSARESGLAYRPRGFLLRGGAENVLDPEGARFFVEPA